MNILLFFPFLAQRPQNGEARSISSRGKRIGFWYRHDRLWWDQNMLQVRVDVKDLQDSVHQDILLSHITVEYPSVSLKQDYCKTIKQHDRVSLRLLFAFNPGVCLGHVHLGINQVGLRLIFKLCTNFMANYKVWGYTWDCSSWWVFLVKPFERF